MSPHHSTVWSWPSPTCDVLRLDPGLVGGIVPAIVGPWPRFRFARTVDDVKAVAAFPGSQEVKIVDRIAPRLSEPDQVMLRMLETGICGTDREICSFEYGTPPPGDDHLVIGHE